MGNFLKKGTRRFCGFKGVLDKKDGRYSFWGWGEGGWGVDTPVYAMVYFDKEEGFRLRLYNCYTFFTLFTRHFCSPGFSLRIIFTPLWHPYQKIECTQGRFYSCDFLKYCLMLMSKFYGKYILKGNWYWSSYPFLFRWNHLKFNILIKILKC